MRRERSITASYLLLDAVLGRSAIAARAVPVAEAQGNEAIDVSSVLPGEAPDRDVASYAAEFGYVLITKDEDFITRYPPGDYALVWVRLGNASNRTLITWLEPRWPKIVSLLVAGERFVEVR